MSDLDFRHSVSERPSNPELPELKRSVSVQTTQGPDVQGAGSAYAANTNWMSALGSAVAQKSSNAIAAKIGGEMGKNPHGDLGPSFTEFDEQLKESYNAQAHSVLSLQAQKLITSSNMELASAPRLNADMIASKQNQVYQGLQKIYSMAPDKIRPNFELQYGSIMLNQNEQLQNRMLHEQKEDRIDTLNSATKQNTQNIYSLELGGTGVGKDGYSLGAKAAFEDLKRSQYAAAARHDIKKEEAETTIDSARQAMLSGNITRQALIAEKNGTLGQLKKELAENPKKFGLNAQDHGPVLNNVMTYMNNQKALRDEEENIKMQQMHNRIATDPTTITGAEWQTFANQVSPLKQEQMKFNLIQAMKSKQEETDGINELLAHYGDARAQAAAGPKLQNATFQRAVETNMTRDPSMSRDEAETQAASAAGDVIPVFTDTLKARIWSGDPAQMDAGMKQINRLNELHAGHALRGLNDEDRALVASYGALRNPADPTSAARLVTEMSQNLEEGVKKVTESKWTNHVDMNTRQAKINTDDWVLKKFGFVSATDASGNHYFGRDFDSPFMATTYAADLLDKYHMNYLLTRGNDALATKLTNEYKEANYGQTEINGTKQWTRNPIEKRLGFGSSQAAVPAIQADIVRQLSIPASKLKADYDAGTSNEYWTIDNPNSKQNISLFGQGKHGALTMTQHKRTGVGTTTKTYDMVLIGTNYDRWEVNVMTDAGPQNVFMNAPMLGVQSYTPDNEWIKKESLGQGHHFPEAKIREDLENIMPLMQSGGA